MNRSIASALIVAAFLLSALPARANQFRIGPLLSARGDATAIGIVFETQLQEKLNGALKISYMDADGAQVTSIQPQLVYRTTLADKWEFFAGGGLAIMPAHVSADSPWEDDGSGTAIGGGVDLGASYRLSENNMLVSPFLEYAFGESNEVRVSYLGLGVRLDFELSQ